MKTLEAVQGNSFAARRPPISAVSYWTPTVGEETTCNGVMIRHTSQSDAAYICGAQGRLEMPSACVWLVPGMEG